MNDTWTDELHEVYEDITSDLEEELRCMLQELTREQQDLISTKLQENFRFTI